MKLGAALRVMGPVSRAETLRACARDAEDAGLDDIWVSDHIAIPPDDAEGSEGRYLDPLATLAYLAAATQRIGLGTAVLVLPYRPPLPTAKWIATIQELSGERLLLGVGIGWMRAEFQALGVSRNRRAGISDAMLEFLRDCFGAGDDIVEVNGQPFLFRPNPPIPPIFVGGNGRHALERAARLGDGWMPMGGSPQDLAPQIEILGELAAAAGKPKPEVLTFAPFPGDQPARCADALHRLSEIGVTRTIFGGGYDGPDAFRRAISETGAVREALDA